MLNPSDVPQSRKYIYHRGNIYFEVLLLSTKAARKAKKTVRDKKYLEGELSKARSAAANAQRRLKAYKEGIKEGIRLAKEAK